MTFFNSSMTNKVFHADMLSQPSDHYHVDCIDQSPYYDDLPGPKASNSHWWGQHDGKANHDTWQTTTTAQPVKVHSYLTPTMQPLNSMATTYQSLTSGAVPKESHAVLAKTSIQMKSRRKFTRSRTGCLTCRARRKKCDETRPVCGNCARLGLVCKSHWATDGQQPITHPPPPHMRSSFMLSPPVGDVGTLDSDAVRLYLPIELNVSTGADAFSGLGISYPPFRPLNASSVVTQQNFLHKDQTFLPTTNHGDSLMSRAYNMQSPPLPRQQYARNGRTSSATSSVTSSASSISHRQSSSVLEDDSSSFYSQSTFDSRSDAIASGSVAELMMMQSPGRAKVVEIPDHSKDVVE